MYSIVFSYIINEQKYAIWHDTLTSYHTELHVSVRVNYRQALLFIVISKQRHIWKWNYPASEMLLYLDYLLTYLLHGAESILRS